MGDEKVRVTGTNDVHIPDTQVVNVVTYTPPLQKRQKVIILQKVDAGWISFLWRPELLDTPRPPVIVCFLHVILQNVKDLPAMENHGRFNREALEVATARNGHTSIEKKVSNNIPRFDELVCRRRCSCLYARLLRQEGCDELQQ
jgi:hypothetical protein